MLTPALLRAAVGCTAERAALFAGPLSEACALFEINTPARIAPFLANVGHESGALKFTSEIWGPTPAQRGYEGRVDLGNTQPGDGSRYRGHGLLQTTGRANHRELRPALLLAGYSDVPDFEAEPERLMQPQWAAASAGHFWHSRKLNALADAGDFVAIVRRINGGENGLADRQRRLAMAQAALLDTPDVQGQPTAPQVPDGRFMPAGEGEPQEKPMLPFLAAVLPSIVSAVPRLIETFGSGSEVSQRNQKAAELVVGVAKEALGAVNEQQVAERLASDPGAPALVKAAVEAKWFDIMVEAGGGGIDGARKANAAYLVPNAKPFWNAPAFWISILLLAMPFMLLVDVFYVHPDKYTGEIRTQIVTGVLMVVGMVGSYWIGSSFGSARKDQARN